MADAAAGASEKKLTLKSADGEMFMVEEAVAMESQVIKHMVADRCADSIIPLHNVNAKILAMVIEYCRKHVEKPRADAADPTTKDPEPDLKTFDKKFVDYVDKATLFDLIRAAHYLDIKGLLDLTCQKVVDMMNGKTPEEIRETFHVANDFTKEKEEEIRRKNQWAFE